MKINAKPFAMSLKISLFSALLISCYTRSDEEMKRDEQELIDARIKVSETTYEENLSKSRIKRFKRTDDSEAVQIEKVHLNKTVNERKNAERQLDTKSNECKDSFFSCMINDLMSSDSTKKRQAKPVIQ